MRQKYVFFAVLNWGLGHATRSLPLIQEFIKLGHQITIGSDGAALSFLQKEIPQLQYVSLPSYHIKYESDKLWQAAIHNGPGILQAIRAENKALNNWLKENKCDVIISDCRFGCYSKKIHSVILSHILQLPSSGFISFLASKSIQRNLNKFHVCWVPDQSESELSGRLSQGKLAIPKKFIGWLSTMEKNDTIIQTLKDVESEELMNNTFDAIAVLSGPEPMRSELEKKVIQQLSEMEGIFLVIGGKLNENNAEVLPKTLQYRNWVGRAELNELINESKYVICRTGYSSLMDLLKLDKRALLIPTPGQPEQEYLGQQLKRSNWCVVQAQSELNIDLGLQTLSQRNHSAITDFEDFSRYKEIIQSVLKDLTLK